MSCLWASLDLGWLTGAKPSSRTALRPAFSGLFAFDTSASHQLLARMLVFSKQPLATGLPVELEEDAGARMPREADNTRHHVSVAGAATPASDFP